MHFLDVKTSVVTKLILSSWLLVLTFEVNRKEIASFANSWLPPISGVSSPLLSSSPFPSTLAYHRVCVCVCVCVCARTRSVTQSCLTLCNPIDCSLPGSSVHEIFQARILEKAAISYSRRSSWSQDQTRVSWVSCIGSQILYCWTTWEVLVMGIDEC